MIRDPSSSDTLAFCHKTGKKRSETKPEKISSMLLPLAGAKLQLKMPPWERVDLSPSPLRPSPTPGSRATVKISELSLCERTNSLLFSPKIFRVTEAAAVAGRLPPGSRCKQQLCWEQQAARQFCMPDKAKNSAFQAVFSLGPLKYVSQALLCCYCCWQRADSRSWPFKWPAEAS